MEHVAHRAFSAINSLMFIGLLASGAAASAEGTKAAADSNPLAGQTSTTMPNGQRLLLGGMKGDAPTDEALLVSLGTSRVETLSARMLSPRANHSATTLADGRVLVFGGSNSQGGLVTNSEIFDFVTRQFQPINIPGLAPRSAHTAVVLLDGTLLLAGGVDADGKTIDRAELWDPRTGEITEIAQDVELERTGAASHTLYDGSVLYFGGKDRNGEAVTTALLFDGPSRAFRPLSLDEAESLLQAAESAVVPQLLASMPPAEASGFPPDGLIAVQFSSRVDVATLNPNTVVLFGATGETEIKVVPAQEGMLVFVTPSIPLLPNARYTLFLDGVLGVSGQKLGFEAFSFTTASVGAGQAVTGDGTGDGGAGGGTSSVTAGVPGKAGQHGKNTKASAFDFDDDEVFVPNAEHRGGRWRTGKRLPDAVRALLDHDDRHREKIEALRARASGPGRRNSKPVRTVAATGESGITGLVLRLSDKPLANATVKIEGRSTRTDEEGRFVITGIPAGHYELEVDGTTANKPGREYAQFVVGVDIKPGIVTEMPFALYVPRIRAKDWVNIDSPVSTDTVVTHPDMPGLEIHVPRGAVFRDRQGRILTRIAVVPVPLDRPPFPVPGNFPSYFMFQPGGAIVQGLDPRTSDGVRIVYPNNTNEPPGSVQNLLMYDSRGRGWFSYGTAQVSEDGSQVVPQRGAGLFEQMASSYLTAGKPGPQPPTPPDNCKSEAMAGDPVLCATGVFLHERTDVMLSDVVPLRLTRTYRPGDSSVRSLGIGTTHNLEMYLRNVIPGDPYALYQLVLPDGAQIDFPRVSGGLWKHTTSPGAFYAAKITVEYPKDGSSGWHYALTLKDGSIYEFDHLSGLLLGIRDRYGNRLDIVRSGGFIARILTSNGRYIDVTNDFYGRITQLQDIQGRVWSYAYNNAGYLSRATYPDNTYEEYTYDSLNRMISVRDRRGHTMVTNEYDANSRVTKQTLADGGTYLFSYTVDANNKVTQTDVTDPRNIVRRMTFGDTGFLTSATSALGTLEQQVITYERQPGTGLIVSKTDALGRKTAYTYDTNGNVTSVTRLAATPDAVTETFTYEPAYNQVASHTNALGKTTTYNYDTLGRLVEIVDPLGNKQGFAYNGAGQPVSVTNGAGETTALAYDFGDLATVTDPLGRTVQYFTDSLGRPITITDPAGLQSKRDYDTNDRVVQATDPMGGVTNLAYDANGNMLSVTDPKGGHHQFIYDAKNRLATRVDPLLASEAFAYDGNDNLVTFTDRKNQATTYTYDVLNRRTGASFADGSTVAYTFDGADRLTQAQDSQTGTVGRGYDNLDRLIAESTAQGSVSYSYDAVGRRIGLTVAGQTPVSYGYDDANRLLQIARGATTVSFAYDAANRRTSLTLPSGITATYSYDVASQLTGITYMNGATVVGDLSYTYDVRGNRIGANGSLASTSLPPAVSSAVYDQANRLTSWNGAAITYDANGNMLSDGTRTYTWDSRNRLISIAGPVAASFQYDALGRRIQKTVGGTTTAYLYDGLNPVQELSGATPTVNLLTGVNLDEFFRRTDSTGDRDIITDALGSTLALADSAGTIQTSYAYDPYGNTAQTGQASTNPFQYTGRENDETGLFYYRARYYSPQLQRFIASDPIGLAGGINTYAYVQNNPLRYSDPSGLVIGSGLSRLLGRLLGRTPEEVAYGGKILDTGVGAAAGDLPDCVGGTDISTPRDLLRGFGGAQAIGLSTATTYGLYGVGATAGSATASVALPVALAGYGGYEVGSSFNNLYEQHRGNSLGGDIYDLVNDGRLYPGTPRPQCGCSN